MDENAFARYADRGRVCSGSSGIGEIMARRGTCCREIYQKWLLAFDGLPVNLQDEERWQLGSAASVITPGTTRKHEIIQPVRPHRPNFNIFRTEETCQGRKVGGVHQ